MKYTVANLDPALHPANERLRKILRDADLVEKDCVTKEEVIGFAAHADAIIAARAPIDGEVMEKLSNCKVIARPGVGTDNVDHIAATRHNIVVVYVPDFCFEEVANHILMLILACNKKLTRLDRYVRGGNWDINLLPPLPAIKDSTLGLVGFGRIGRSLSAKVRPLGMNVLAYDPFVNQAVFREHNVRQAGLEELLKKSDYVSLQVPLTSETKNLIGAKELRMMKPSAYLINCARGAVVDEAALIEALSKKMIAGAALDVLVQEPPSKDNPLLKMDNVILTPHTASYSDEAMAHLREKIYTQIADVLMGRKPEFVRNPEVLEKVKLR